MLAIERRNRILAKLTMEGKVLVSDLSREFGVTEETIRRDLEKLEKEGLAKKTYGGAVKTEDMKADLPFYVRKQTNVEAKRYIASIISGMINDGDYLMLDSSTTALFVIKHILHKKKITLITNSIEILLELSNKSGWTVISTGGTLKEGGLSLLGYQAERMISGFHVDMAICSSKGIDIQNGITDSNELDAEIKKAFFNAAKKRVLAIDSTKFDKSSFVKVCDISDVDMIVTDKCPPNPWQEHLKACDVEVKYQPEPEESD